MQPSDRHLPVTLRLVVTTGRAVVDRKPAERSPRLNLVVDDRPRRQLLNTMLLVATARRNAASRIRAKLQAGRVASLVLVAGLAAIAICQGVFAETMSVPAHRDLTIMSLLAVISVLLLRRQQADERAIVAVCELDDCVAVIDALSCELRQGRIADGDLVHDVRRRYNDVLRGCSVGHTQADYLAARIALDQTSRPRWRLKARYVADVYMRELALAALPFLILTF